MIRPRRLAAIAGTVTAAAMIAFPLATRGGAVRVALSTTTVAGLAATTAAAARGRWGWRRTAAALGAVTAGTGIIEGLGTATGWPFGRYTYGGRLRPAVVGVPAIVPLAWWAMAVPARETAHAALAPRSTAPARIALGAVALTAWDLFLDPQMTTEGYWRWKRRGAYHGIPLSNFAGWLVTSAAVMAVLDVVLPPHRPEPLLVAEYAGMAAMETVGFAGFFRQPLVAITGAAGMGPLAAAAIAGLSRGRAR